MTVRCPPILKRRGSGLKSTPVKLHYKAKKRSKEKTEERLFYRIPGGKEVLDDRRLNDSWLNGDGLQMLMQELHVMKGNVIEHRDGAGIVGLILV
tara:strand:- start:653 stop:937 length:285 start_codon:yes stop_codon:yes gene_type:complete